MTRLAQNYEVGLMVSISGISKTTDRDFMMNLTGFAFTNLALSLRQPAGLLLCCSPSTTAIVPPVSPIPSGMIFTPHINGLPFSHAAAVTKRLFGMEITCSPDNIFPAINARFSVFVFGFAPLIAALMIALRRAINAVKALKSKELITTGRAGLFDSAYFVFESWHNYLLSYSIPNCKEIIEIEKKYCDIAIDRLRQEVLPLNTPESYKEEQMEL